MGTATRLLVLVTSTAVLIGSPVARAAEEVDLLLVLSSDVSRSIEAPKFKLQRDGYAAAIVNPRLIEAIHSGALGKIAISFVEWSGDSQLEIVIDWTVIATRPPPRIFPPRSVRHRAPSGTEPRSAAASILPWRSSPARRGGRVGSALGQQQILAVHTGSVESADHAVLLTPR